LTIKAGNVAKKYDEHLFDMLAQRQARVGIIGLGYVGLPLLLHIAGKGFPVTGFDNDPARVSSLNARKTYLRHIDVSNIPPDFFVATTDMALLAQMDFVIICVPTPLGKHREPDLSFVISSTKSVANSLKKGQVIILESTTYPGTTDEDMLPILEGTGLKVGTDFFVGYSPEREDPGNINFSTSSIPKITSGITDSCARVVDAFYRALDILTVPVGSTRTAEATKILENTYRAVNIALVNELKVLFQEMDIDIWEVIEAAKTKPFGYSPFYPGPGLGGHCIPIDPFYLTWKAHEYDLHTRLIELSGEINTEMPNYVIKKIAEALNSKRKSVNTARILIVGVAYKKNVDDYRESPALPIISKLAAMGAQIQYFDPFVSEIFLDHSAAQELSWRSVDDITQAVKSSDVLVLVTDHDGLDYARMAELADLIVDTRNAFGKLNLSAAKVWRA